MHPFPVMFKVPCQNVNMKDSHSQISLKKPWPLEWYTNDTKSLSRTNVGPNVWWVMMSFTPIKASFSSVWKISFTFRSLSLKILYCSFGSKNSGEKKWVWFFKHHISMCTYSLHKSQGIFNEKAHAQSKYLQQNGLSLIALLFGSDTFSKVRS